jgi:hypothetical protein
MRTCKLGDPLPDIRQVLHLQYVLLYMAIRQDCLIHDLWGSLLWVLVIFACLLWTRQIPFDSSFSGAMNKPQSYSQQLGKYRIF